MQPSASMIPIVGTLARFAWLPTIDHVPMKATELALGLSKEPWVVLLCMIMETLAAILIVADTPVDRVIVRAWPWIATLTPPLLALTYAPAASMWLPGMLVKRGGRGGCSI